MVGVGKLNNYTVDIEVAVAVVGVVLAEPREQRSC